MAFSELRVHGVSGTPPRDMLYTDPVTESTLDDYTKVYRVPSVVEGYDPGAGAFHWGGLTAGSWHTAFWILLAPFAFANVAGWLLAKRNRGTVMGVRLAGLALTALFASQSLNATVVVRNWILDRGFPGWGQRLATLIVFGALLALAFWIAGLLSIRSHFAPLGFWCRVRLLLWPSADWLQPPAKGRECKPGSSDDWSDPAFAGIEKGTPWVADKRLWLPHSIIHRTRRCHFAVAMAIVSMGVSRGIGLPDSVYWSGVALLATAVALLVLTTLAPDRRWIVTLTAWVALIPFAHASVITLLTPFTELPGQWGAVHSTNLAISIAFGAASALTFVFGGGKAVGALAFAAFFGGAMGIAAVTVLERLTGVDERETVLANGAGWVAVWMLVVVLVLIFTASLVSLMRVHPEPDPPPKAQTTRGLDPEAKERVKRERKALQHRAMLIRVRRVVSRVGVLLWSAMVVGLASAAGVTMFLCRDVCDPSNLEAERWGWVLAPLIGAVAAVGTALWPLGGWIRYAVPVAVAAALLAFQSNLLGADSSLVTMRFLRVQVNLTRLVDASLAIAILIPAVWMLQSIVGGVRDGEKRRKTGLIWDVVSFWPRYFHPMSPPPYGPNAVRELMDELHGESLVLSAHSQGSVVATVALSQLDENQAGRIKRVITYGSPLQLIYSKLFVQSGLDTLVKTRGGIRDLPWYNLWRRSDYLGGMCLPLPDEANVNFEADGLGHSGYECTRQFRQLTKGIPPVEPGDEAARCGARSA